MANIEAFTVLAVIEAQDKASALLGGIFSSLDRTAAAFKTAGEAAELSGRLMAEGLLTGDTAAERLANAQTRLTEAQSLARESAIGLREAQFALAEAQARGALTAGEVTKAQITLRQAQLDNSIASKELREAQWAVADAEEGDTVAADALAAAQVRVRESTTALKEAQITLLGALEAQEAHAVQTAAAQAKLTEANAASRLAATNLREATAAQAAAQAEVTTASAASSASLSMATGTMFKIAGATALASGYSVKLAGDFQQQTQTLVAGAGVQQNEIDGVRASILKMAVDTGTSTEKLNESFFAVNSRLGDVAKSTEVVKDAAELAKVHMADLNTVSVALAASMNAYSKAGLTAGQASNILGVVVEQGGMSFQELSNSLSTVLPKAQEAGLQFSQVTAAIATMTRSGQTASMATQDLAHTIAKLQSPTAEMLNTWNQMGLTQKQVADALHGPGGLQAAMDLIYNTAKSKLGPAGEVVIQTFKQSQDATNSLTKMLQTMDPAAKSLATQLQNGTISYKDYLKAAKGLSEEQATQAIQFKNLFDKANGFNDALKAGKPGFSDFSALLKSSYGDATSMQTALLLGGDAAKKWAEISEDAAKAGQDSANGIRGWNAVQDTLNQKMAKAKEEFQTAAITLGTALLPAVVQVVNTISPWVEKMGKLIEHHQTFTKIAVALGLALGVLALAIKTITIVTKAWEAVQVILDAELWANPIGVIILAILALIAAVIAIGAAVVYAYNHFKWFHDFINMVWSGIKTGAIDVWHALEAAFNGIVTAAVWVYQNGILPMWHGIQAAWDGIVTGAKAVWNFLVGIFNGIVNAVVSFGSSVWNGIVSVWNGILGFFKKWWPLLLVIFDFPLAVLISIWNHFHEEITSTAKTVWGYISGFFSDTWDLIKDGAQGAWHLIRDYIVDPLKEAWNWSSDVLSSFGKFIGDMWDWMGKRTSQGWHLIRDYIINPVKDAYNWVNSLLGDINNAIGNKFNEALNWLSGVWDWFGDVGKNIVNGIIHGLNEGWHWLMDAVKNLAEGALQTAKNFLGIKSPSTVFADEVGQHIPGGVALGISKHTQTAVNAVSAMAGALPQAIGVQGAVNIGVNGLNAAGTTFATGLGLAVPAAGGVGAGATHVTIDLRDAVVAGDRGIEDLTNRIGAAFAQRGLPQAGVRIHY